MANLIDKDALVTKIERIIKVLQNNPYENHKIICHLNSLKQSLDTLEVKEVDLEKAVDDYIYTHDGRKRLALELDWKQCNITFNSGKLIDFAKHFFELGLKAQKGE